MLWSGEMHEQGLTTHRMISMRKHKHLSDAGPFGQWLIRLQADGSQVVQSGGARGSRITAVSLKHSGKTNIMDQRLIMAIQLLLLNFGY